LADTRVRVLEAISPAWAHVRRVLFQPFDLGRWFILGFLSFLQSLGEGGCGFRGFDIPERKTVQPHDEEVLREILRWIAEHLPVVLTICGVGLLLLIALGLLLMWLSARGTFCYLDCIVTNRAEVRRPWREHRTLANSYFLFQVIVTLVTLAILFILTVPVGVLVFEHLRSQEGLRAETERSESAGWMGQQIFGTGVLHLDIDEDALSRDPQVWVVLIVWVLLVVGVVLASSILHVVMVDFVAPVQYLTKAGAFEALKAVLGLWTSHLGAFLLYLIVRLGFVLALGCAVVVVGCLTCCVFFCLVSIPVVSQTVLQPVYAFFRTFPLFILRQFGSAWDVFSSANPIEDALPPPVSS
jgi:hypothetical protein